MTRNYWRNILAITGLISAVVVLGIAYKLYDASQQRQTYYEYQPASHASLKQGMPRKSPPSPYEPRCKNPQSNEDADLCAQWAAVEQVTESNRMASLNLRFAIAALMATIIGTVALIWTLIETRVTSRNELRAYLHVDACAVAIGDSEGLIGKAVSVVAVKNVGATPAHSVIHWCDIAVDVIAKNEWMKAPAKLERINHSALHPGGHITADRSTRRALTPKTIEAIELGKKAVFVFGAIEYIDVFGNEHRTDYRYFYSGKWPPPNNPLMRFPATGNTAT